jgi:hypothetical protein
MPKRQKEIAIIPSHRQPPEVQKLLDQERHRHNWSMSKLISVIVEAQVKAGFKDIRAIYGTGKTNEMP